MFWPCCCACARRTFSSPEADAWVAELSQRFCVSKVSCDLLCIATGNDPAYRVLIQAAYSSIGSMAEAAMSHAISGSPALTVETLLLKGSQTRNAKVHDLKMRCCPKGSQINVGKNPLRSVGGLQWRV
jgi:hypothetical protein